MASFERIGIVGLIIALVACPKQPPTQPMPPTCTVTTLRDIPLADVGPGGFSGVELLHSAAERYREVGVEWRVTGSSQSVYDQFRVVFDSSNALARINSGCSDHQWLEVMVPVDIANDTGSIRLQTTAHIVSPGLNRFGSFVTASGTLQLSDDDRYASTRRHKADQVMHWASFAETDLMAGKVSPRQSQVVNMRIADTIYTSEVLIVDTT